MKYDHFCVGGKVRLLATIAAVCIAFVLSGCESRQNQLSAAVTRNDVAAVDRLLNTPGVDPNFKSPRLGMNDLTSAASLNRVEIVKLLLEHGANPSIADHEGNTPLMAAAYHGNTEIVSTLIAAGADVNAAESRYGYTALASAVQKGHVEPVRILLNAGARADTALNNGLTSKDLARSGGYPEIVQLLAQAH